MVLGEGYVKITHNSLPIGDVYVKMDSCVPFAYKKINGVDKVNNRLLRTAICFILITSLLLCEATMGFATTGTVTNNGGASVTDEVENTTESYEDWDVKGVEYKSHVFEGGNSYTYTGSEIKPKPVSLTVAMTYEKDGVSEVVDKTITDFSDVSISYENNVAIGTGNVKATVEGESISIPFTIVFGGIKTVKASPRTHTSIKVSWTKVAGASGYVIYRSTKSGSGFKAIKTITSGSTTSYSNTKLTLGKMYYYKVRPYRTVDGSRVYGAYSKVDGQKVQPATPVISSVKRSSYNSLTVRWEKVSGVSGYRVYRSTSANGKYKRIATVKGSSKVSYKDKKKTCGKTYYYKVKAYKTSKGKRHYGYSSSAKSGRTTPAAISFTSKTMSWYSSVELKWKKSAGATGYDIYRSTSSESGFTRIKTITSGKTTKFTDKGLDGAIKYYYKIRPFKTIGGTKVYGSYSKTYTKILVSKKMETLVKKYEGKPYRWGGNTPKGWDCSGFVQWAIKYLYGKKIPRSGGAQARGGKYVNKNKMSTWKPGDVLVYKSGGSVTHVGLYIGGGKMMHALNSRYDTVIQDVSYYEKWDRGNHLAGVRRYN